MRYSSSLPALSYLGLLIFLCQSIALSEIIPNFATSYMQIMTMTYLNRFHKESVERCLRKVAESKSLQMNCEEEVRKIKEMHNQIAQRYPKGA